MDQASQLREMVSRMTARAPTNGQARVLAITSGKGGVGKTNVAVNLAARLAMMGRRVLLLDADMGMANADVLCNINPRANLAHVVAGRRRLEEAMVDAPGGFTLIPGASGLATMASLSEFERKRLVNLLRHLDRNYDLVLVDTGAGISPNVLNFVEAADESLLVTTGEPTAITDAYALIKTLSRRGRPVRVSLIVNMARDRVEARRVFARIDAVCRRFLDLSLTDAGYVAMDPRVVAAVRRRTPFVMNAPDCAASVCINQLAHKLDRHVAEPSGEGFFRKVAAWLAG